MMDPVLFDLAARRRRLRRWFASPLGYSLAAAESDHLHTVWPQLYGTVAVQLGATGEFDLLESCLAPTRMVLELPGSQPVGASRWVYGLPEAMPFDSRSIDLMCLPHTLEFAADPHQVLREAHRVLTPEGHLVLLGFNPLSLWGMRRFLARGRGTPWSGHFLHLQRVKDWLKLLDFELGTGRMFYYRPPFALRGGFRWLEQAGDRWWPMGAAVYLLVAKKRLAGMTPIKPRWRQQAFPSRAVARPALRLVHRKQ